MSRCTRILENCKRGQKKKILQLPGEKQKRFCFWGCYLRIFLHTILFVPSGARVWGGDVNWLVGSGGGTSASASEMGGLAPRGSGVLPMAAIRGSASWPLAAIDRRDGVATGRRGPHRRPRVGGRVTGRLERAHRRIPPFPLPSAACGGGCAGWGRRLSSPTAAMICCTSVTCGALRKRESWAMCWLWA